MIGLTGELFEVFGEEISGRDLILILGGLFLFAKATFEIHENLEEDDGHSSARVAASFGAVIVQIVALDLVFSLDSVITAVGMVDEVSVMVAAVTIAILIMLVSAGFISDFVSRHPTVKILALSFLLLIGLSLIAEGVDVHIPKGFIYFGIGYACFVEALNLRARRKRGPKQENVRLRQRYGPGATAAAAPTAPEQA